MTQTQVYFSLHLSSKTVNNKEVGSPKVIALLHGKITDNSTI